MVLHTVQPTSLPQKRYNVMTTETVMAQGTAVLLECAGENYVMADE